MGGARRFITAACVFAAVLAPASAEAATSYSELILEDAPEVYLPLDERTATDTTPNLGAGAVEAFVSGDPVVDDTGALEAAEGNRSFHFDGEAAWWGTEGDYVRLQAAPGEVLTDTWTVEAWVKLDRQVGIPELFNLGAEIRFDADGIYTNAGTYAPALSLHEWHHIALTATPGQLELYVDGVSRGARSTGAHLAYSDAAPLLVGWRVPGSIDEVAAYDHVLAADRIAARHSAGTQGINPVPPAVVTLPSVSGTPTVGKEATCDVGEWSGAPREFDVRWLRDGLLIPGAIARKHTLGAEDLGHAIRCDVVARNVAGESPPVLSSNAIVMGGGGTPSTYRELVLQDDPRMYLPLDERSGSTAANLGRDGGAAQINGNPQLGVYGAIEGDDPSSRAMRLDGDDHMTYRPGPGVMVHGDFTTEAWFKHEGWGWPRSIWNNHAEISIENHGLRTFAGFFGAQVSSRAWHHVVAVVDVESRTWEMFLDGASVGRYTYGEGTVYNGDWLSQTMGWGYPGWLDELAIYDYTLTPSRIAEHHRRGVEGFSTAAPSSRVAPRVLGDPVVGRAATCDEGDWSGGPREFVYRWLRNGATIAGASERRYSLSADDLGKRVTCAVVARNLDGASTETASANGLDLPAGHAVDDYRDLVRLDNPATYVPLTDVVDGVTPNLGYHGGQAYVRGDATRAGSAIANDTDPSLHLDGDDHIEIRTLPGTRVTGEWTAEGWVYLERWGGDPHLFNHGANLRFEEGRLNTVPGAFFPGITTGSWHHVVMTALDADRDSAGVTEMWVDGVSLGTLPGTGGAVYGDGFPSLVGWHLPGALDELAVYEYRLTPSRIVAHYRAGVEPPYPTPKTPPSLAGEVRVGSELTCRQGTWTGDPTSFEHRWLRDGAVIDGATAATYVLTAADGGHAIACEIRASNARGTSEWAASGNASVPPVPRNVTPPAVTGDPWPGERVTCALGGWVDGENHEVRWQLDGSDVAGLPGDQYDITGPEGGRLRCLVRMEGPGGTSDWVPSEAVVIDGTPPVVDIVCPTGHLNPGDTAVATFTASDAHSGLVTPESGTVTLVTTSAGTHVAPVTARDAAGHETTATCDYRVLHLRPGAPVPASGVSADGVVALTWSSLEPGSPAPAGFELQAREAGDAGWTDVASPSGWSSTVSALAEGTWRFRVRAVDATFDDAWSDESGPVVVDRTAPVVDLTCPTGRLQRGAVASATFVASDGGSGLVTPASDTVALDTSAVGTWTARVTARDAAGHASEGTCTYQVVHNGPGAPALSGGSSSPDGDGLIELTWPSGGAPDASQYELQARRAGDPGWTDVASVGSRTYAFTTPLAEGTWTFRVRALDADFDDAWSPASSPVVVDRTPPAVDLTCPTATVVPGAVASATYTASDAGSGLVTQASGSVALDTSTAGTFTASVTARDAAGHETEATCTYDVAYAPPGAPRLTTGSPNPTNDGRVELTWTLPAGTPARYVLEGRRATGGWVELARPTTNTHRLATALAEGTWTFQVRADDPQFDASWSPPSSTPVKVDLRAPSAPTVTADKSPVPFSGGWYRDSVTLTVSATDPDLADNSAGSGFSTPAPVTFDTTGIHPFTPSVTDRAGNTATGAAATYRVDATAPALTWTCPDVGYGDTATGTWTATDAGAGVLGSTSGSVTLTGPAIGTRTGPAVTVYDRVGHATTGSCTYKVLYDWQGWRRGAFNEPDWTEIDPDDTSVAAMRFDLGRDWGNNVAAVPPVVEQAPCPSGNGRNLRNQDELAASASGQWSDDNSGQYTYGMPVPNWPVGTCGRLVLRLNDGSDPRYAYFEIT